MKCLILSIKKLVTGKKNAWETTIKKELEILPNSITKIITEVNEIQKILPYKRGMKNYIPSCHLGQRKLLMMTLNFLTNIYSNKHQKMNVLYVGSAPNFYGAFVSDLFPTIKFFFIDPNIHRIRKKGFKSSFIYLCVSEQNNSKEVIRIYSLEIRKVFSGLRINPSIKHISQTNLNIIIKTDIFWNFVNNTDYNIYIMETFFTKELANIFAGKNIYFMSDIRSDFLHNKDKLSYSSEADVVVNLTQQALWVKIMKPVYSLLKFRCPFIFEKFEVKQLPAFVISDLKEAEEKKLPIINLYNEGKFFYFEGKLLLQPWTGKSSTETRLFLKGVPKLIKYDIFNYEGRLNYYNKIVRVFQPHENNYVNIIDSSDYTNDSALENYIWTMFNKKVKKRSISLLVEISFSAWYKVPKRRLIFPRKMKKEEYEDLFINEKDF
jgi:hypothetical protein